MACHTVGQRRRRDEVVELLVVELAAGQQLSAERPRMQDPRAESVDRVHRPRIGDAVGGDQRRIQRAGRDRNAAAGRCSCDLSAPHTNTRSNQKYCEPTVEFRFFHSGCSGSAGGLVGLGPMWQKPHAMPTRYGRTRSFCCSSSGRCSSAPDPTAGAPPRRNPDWETAAVRRCRWVRHSMSRPAGRRCHARRA